MSNESESTLEIPQINKLAEMLSQDDEQLFANLFAEKPENVEPEEIVPVVTDGQFEAESEANPFVAEITAADIEKVLPEIEADKLLAEEFKSKRPERIKSFLSKITDFANQRSVRRIFAASMIGLMVALPIVSSFSKTDMEASDHQTADEISRSNNQENHKDSISLGNFDFLHERGEQLSPEARQAQNREIALQNVLDKIEADISKPVHFSRGEIIEDEMFVNRGSTLYYADILRAVDQLTKDQFANGTPSPGYAKKYANTVELLLSGKRLHPQAVKFQLYYSGDSVTMNPVNFRDNVEVKETSSCDVLVIGGELESITTAMRAADQGMSVTMVYSGPLGGLSSDAGGNMRYFDGVGEAPRTQVHTRLFRDGLGMESDNLWSIPNNTDGKLSSYLSRNYPGIRLVQTASYDSTHVEVESGMVNSVLTDEGVKVNAKYVIDTEPESRTAEKIGIPETIETPAIGYGMVFDVKGFDNKTLDQLGRNQNFSPEKVMQMADVDDSVLQNPDVKVAYDELRSSMSGGHSEAGYMAWGYQAVSKAYAFYMRCLEANPQTPDRKKIAELNNLRKTSGFNIALRDGEATFNSLSYSFNRTIMQHDHDLYRDSEFKLLRDIEIPSLQNFLQMASGDGGLQVVMPHQLYVRQATASYETVAPYEQSDFTNKPNGLWMTYPMDLRDVDRGRIGSDRALDKMPITGKTAWSIRPDASETAIPNYFAVSRSAMPSQYVGALRILQNLIGQGVAVIDHIKSTDGQGPQAGPSDWGSEQRSVKAVRVEKGEQAGVRTLAKGAIELVIPKT